MLSRNWEGELHLYTSTFHTMVQRWKLSARGKKEGRITCLSNNADCNFEDYDAIPEKSSTFVILFSFP
jgi:hypothetical protein